MNTLTFNRMCILSTACAASVLLAACGGGGGEDLQPDGAAASSVAAASANGVMNASETEQTAGYSQWKKSSTTVPSTSWTRCATEGGTCSFSGTKQVRYGLNQTWVVKTLTGPVSCSNSTFGDPLQGTVKVCEYETTTTTATSTAPAPAPAPVPAPAPAPTAGATPAPALTPTAAPSSNDRYVSTTGSDSNPGTESAPFKTLQKAASVAQPGMTIRVAPGTYNGDVYVTTSGTQTAPITFASQSKWGAKIVGLFQPRGNYIGIQDFEVTNPSGSQGIETLGSYTRVIGNKVHGVPGSCPSSGGAGIHTYRSTGTVIENNWVYDVGNNSGVACYLTHTIYLEGNGEIVRNNIVHGSQGWGIVMWHGATKATIANNTVINNLAGGILVGAGDADATINDYTVVANNIVYKNGSLGGRHGISEDGVTGTHNTYINNLVYGNLGSNYVLLNGLKPTGDIASDPQFKNYTGTATGDYHVQATSPTIGKGVATYAPSADFAGTARPAGSPVDLGAYKY